MMYFLVTLLMMRREVEDAVYQPEEWLQIAGREYDRV
jgi:hypothetical protein